MKYLLTLVLSLVLVFHLINISQLITPVHQISSRQALQNAAISVGMGDPGEEVVKAILLASQQTGLSQNLLMALMFTESSFQRQAVSSKKYQGLMQIPWKIHWEDANTLTGARILLEKLSIAKGNVRDALVLYKGWRLNDKKGEYEADKVLTLSRKLKETQI